MNALTTSLYFRALYTYRLGTRSVSGLQLWNEELSTDIKHKIEKHWAPKLSATTDYKGDLSKDKYYVLPQFPYPSGSLHMGHVRVYTISDAIARFQRMNGKNVIHPIGWDAFGLPAENAAIDRNVAPNEWTRENILHMQAQLRRLGCSFEWHRELSTCDSNYYRWTQELFLKLYDANLVYRKEAFVNWDPIDQTVLADEQVDENGLSWRSMARVERRLLKQWFVRTTRLARNLLDGLDDPSLEDWRDIIKIQRNWIGQCDGMSFDFQLGSKIVTLWTRHPEYMTKAKFVVLSKSHNLSNLPGDVVGSKTVRLHDKLQNPLTKENIPVFVTDDFEFLERTNCHLGIPGVVQTDATFCDKYDIAYDPIEILDADDKIRSQAEISHHASALGVGGYWTSATLRDWLISRQRYWGTPIPIIYCSQCGTVPVPRKDLPVELPRINEATTKGSSHLSDVASWINVTCPKCGGKATRETDTMDTFVDSSWYYLRYLNRDCSDEMFDVAKAKTMMPVDLYIGGKEHAALHLYYARFVSHFLHSLGLLAEREPFKRLLVQGMVMGRTYRFKGTEKYVKESEVEIQDLKKNKAIHRETREPVIMTWEKMSKSKHNGVDPERMFNEYSIDTTRLLILADVAPMSHRNWNSNTFPGILTWQRRLWLTIGDFIKYRTKADELQPSDPTAFATHDDYMYDSRNFYVKGATFNFLGSQQLSVAISKMQGLTNSLRKMPPEVFARSFQFQRALACQIVLLAPIAPHFASELWSGFLSASNRLSDEDILWDGTVLQQKWPEIDSDYKMKLICRVNGVDCATVKVSYNEIQRLSRHEAINIALAQPEIQKALSDKMMMESLFVLPKGYDGTVEIRAVSSMKEHTLSSKN